MGEGPFDDRGNLRCSGGRVSHSSPKHDLIIYFRSRRPTRIQILIESFGKTQLLVRVVAWLLTEVLGYPFSPSVLNSGMAIPSSSEDTVRIHVSIVELK